MKQHLFLFCLFYALCSGSLSLYGKRWASMEQDTPTENPKDYIYQELMIEGGDGYKLFTRIYLPQGAGPWPVVITRTPYTHGETTGDHIGQGRQYAQQGMGYILQYCRGKGGSEGAYEPNIYEREDGLKLIHWVAAQPWCRSMGLFGSSYTALTGWIVADSLPDKVKGLYLHHYGVDRHLSAYKDGLFRQDILTGWAIDNATEISERPFRNPEEPYYPEYRFMPQREMDIRLLGAELPWYRQWIRHTDYEDPYWHQGVWAQLRNVPSQIEVPVTLVAGLFDHHLEGTLKGYELLPPETRRKSRLILGPWNHFYQITPTIHHPRHAKDIEVFADEAQWLRQVVAEEQVAKGGVEVYFIGADRWVSFDSWPICPDKEKTYFLTSAKGADVKTEQPTEEKTDKKKTEGSPLVYKLIPDTETGSGPGSVQDIYRLSFVYDPTNPVMSVGGETLFNSPRRRGSQLQPEIGYRDDILFFLSDPLEQPLTIAGSIRATIYMSSDCEDTSLTYKVSEVAADGTAVNIRSGITTLAYRNDRFGARQVYTPHEIVALEIETLPVTWQVKPGNRLRVDITSSNFPEYSIHSNYAGIWSEQSKTRKAHQTVYMGEAYPSRLTIPIIDLEKYPISVFSTFR